MPSTQATFMATSANPLHSSASPSARSSRIPRPRPASHLDEQWRKSSTSTLSSSSNDSGWKTSSSSNIKKDMETWKMSGKPRHAQLHHVAAVVEDDPLLRRQSATPTMMSINSPWQPKPLPQEPSPPVATEPFNIVYPIEHAPFHLNTPLQPPAFINNTDYHSYPPSSNASYDAMYQASNVEYPPAMMNAVSAPYPPATFDSSYQPPMANLDYNNYMHHHHQPVPPQPLPQEYPPYTNMPPLPPQQQHPYNEQSMYPPSSSMMSQAPLPAPVTPMTATPVMTNTAAPVPVTGSNDTAADDKSKKKKEKPEKKVRQITVQSINAEHRVWIDVLPSETGLSLAEKIHIIATFRTRKIVSITTASGRKVPLDNRPVFGSWMDMENFVDGERWTVEWRENDRGVVDRFFSKVVQAGGGKRKDHVVKEKD
ncbi:hypothetical protein MUCCIDRAFT_82573 [Mucor lusitanicus CBS 277.49]|uniref:Uncharacterized protein n=1 Tax=Mucor lusitanicus CBS 277.49 TaxID=747725 RepID=A0A168KAS1_MUCCL|nr:hypothetical protein MUCCIDRAFT_82573 [Mucor lusitanicus CBS 277.49]